MSGVLDLLRGRLPLKRALWSFALLYGTLLNLVATLAALAALAAGWPGAVGAALYLLPLPYIVVAVFGVWRSAERATPAEAGTARLLVALWAVAMILL